MNPVCAMCGQALADGRSSESASKGCLIDHGRGDEIEPRISRLHSGTSDTNGPSVHHKHDTKKIKDLNRPEEKSKEIWETYARERERERGERKMNKNR